MKRLSLIIERNNDGKVWGRVEFKNDLMVDFAESVNGLAKKMKMLLKENYELDPANIEFDLAYDLTALFQFSDYLNISAIAKKADINQSLMRQYASGTKFPSKERAEKITLVINQLGRELSSIRIVTRNLKYIKNRNKGASKKEPLIKTKRLSRA